ncbi:MAG: FAD-binding protein [Gammaproteobacteria bacterium]
MKKHKGVLILGAGSAGLLLAKHLGQEFITANCSPREISVIGRASGGSSVLSSWYIAQYEPEAFEQRLVSGLGPHRQPEQMRLVQYIARNHIKATNDFASQVVQHVDIGGIKRFHDGFSGIKTLTGYSSVNPLPGRRILDFLKREVMSLGVQVSVATITDLARTADGFEAAGIVRGNERVVRQAAKLVIATGGMAHLFEFSTSGRGNFPNVLQLAYEHLGLAVENLDRAVFFPFAVNHEGFRAGSILPPSFMTRARILLQTLDGRLREFLSDELKAAVKTGDYRPQFPELIRLFDRVIKGGNRVMVRTLMSQDEFETYKGEDHYGYVFKSKGYEDAQLISVAPAYHSALGGIVVDEQCRSSDPNVFAIGESALVFGFDRPIGGEHVSAITMAPLVASVIARELIKEGRTTVGKKVVRAATTLLDARMAIDEQDHKIVELGPKRKAYKNGCSGERSRQRRSLYSPFVLSRRNQS